MRRRRDGVGGWMGASERMRTSSWMGSVCGAGRVRCCSVAGHVVAERTCSGTHWHRVGWDGEFGQRRRGTCMGQRGRGGRWRTREGMKRRRRLHARIRFSASRQLILREQRLVLTVSYRPLILLLLVSNYSRRRCQTNTSDTQHNRRPPCVGTNSNDEQYGARHDVRQRARASDAFAPGPPR